MASLKTEYGIRKFASYLVIKYSEVHCVDGKSVKGYEDFMNLEISRDIFKSIDLLLDRYKNIINVISIEVFEDMYYLYSKHDYMLQLMSRCLKLSGDKPTFFEFLLVCVYIGKFSERIHKKYRCCKILKVTTDCLESVYVREYRKYFKENEGFQGLADFCRSLSPIEHLKKVGGEDLITVFPEIDPEEKVENFRYLNDVDVVIQLNDDENELLKMKGKDYFKPSRKDDSNFLISLFASDVAAQDEDLETFDYVSEKTSKTGIRCVYCESKCGQYLTHLVNELASD